MIIYQPQNILLKSYVGHMVSMTLRKGGLSSIVDMPTGDVFISIFVGNAQCTYQSKSYYEVIKGKAYVASRQLEMAYLNVEDGEMRVIGIKLPPHALYQLLGISQEEVTGKIFLLEDFWGKDVESLCQQLEEQTNPASQLNMVEHFLSKKMMSCQMKVNSTIDEAIFLIRISKGNISMSDLSAKLRVSSRTIQRKFLEAVGISPKAYCNVIRFNNAFSQLITYQKNIQDIVSEAGYYDQSHMIHHFQKVAGKSPSQLVEEQERFLYFFKQEAWHEGVDDLANTLSSMYKLCLF
ncbi:helix-turn-helix transcriptional regulator [Catalinimonas sp. 4WD22]|uniref:helix-turn-helix transcriptional regulator n=1 Tax=Catalinimonas locisalis TaxID=3133978 RepID=UPI0031015196